VGTMNVSIIHSHPMHGMYMRAAVGSNHSRAGATHCVATKTCAKGERRVAKGVGKEPQGGGGLQLDYSELRVQLLCPDRHLAHWTPAHQQHAQGGSKWAGKGMTSTLSRNR
jgi:hypothetical protein